MERPRWLMQSRYLPHRVGALGEDAAERYLESWGYRILDRSARTSVGELDLVAEHRGTVVFVEVKSRSGDFAPPESAVDAAKRRRVERCALLWLRRRGMAERPMRFDVVAVTRGQVRHIPDAWGL